MCKLKSSIDSCETFDFYRHRSADTSIDDYKQYTARFAYDINTPEDKQMPFDVDKKLANEVFSKIKEIRDRFSLTYLFKITSPAA